MRPRVATVLLVIGILSEVVVALLCVAQATFAAVLDRGAGWLTPFIAPLAWCGLICLLLSIVVDRRSDLL